MTTCTCGPRCPTFGGCNLPNDGDSKTWNCMIQVSCQDASPTKMLRLADVVFLVRFHRRAQFYNVRNIQGRNVKGASIIWMQQAAGGRHLSCRLRGPTQTGRPGDRDGRKDREEERRWQVLKREDAVGRSARRDTERRPWWRHCLWRLLLLSCML